MVAPVTKAPPQLDGKPNNCRSHFNEISSTNAATGDVVSIPQFWSQAPANQLAAKVTGVEPPITNPKYLGPATATVPCEPALDNSPKIFSGSFGFSGRGIS